MKYLFLTHESIETTPVAKAMFWDIAELLAKYHEVILLSGDENKIRNSNIQHIIFSADRNTSIIKRTLKFATGWKYLARYIFSDVTIFCRSYPAMLLFGTIFSTFGKRVIFDTRGLFFHELYDSGYLRKPRFFSIFLLLEKWMIRSSESVICISRSQRDYYAETCGFNKTKYFVVHNGAPQARTSIGDERGQGQISLLFVGSLTKWHSIERVKCICDALAQITNISLTIYTRSTEDANRTFEGSQYEVRVQEHNFRNEPLKFDYGFSLITGGLSKEVCCPVKFAEYLASGTKVIASKNVRFQVEFVQPNNGLLIDLSESDQTIAKKILNHYLSRSDEFEFPMELSFNKQFEKISAVLVNK